MSIMVDIKKIYKEFTLQVQLDAGNEILAILGASGCGKSLTLKCIAGIERPDDGKIVLDGKTLFDSVARINLSPQKRKTGYLFQNYALFSNMTVEENIASGIQLPIKMRAKIVAEQIDSFYLKGMENKYPAELSGGQQQRVAIARMMASNPEIIMLDEPFSALDSYLKWQMEQEMMNALDSFRGTTLFVSHNRDEVYRICDRIAVMSHGKVDSVGEKWEIFREPKTLSAALLTGCKNFSHAKKRSDFTLEALDWGIILYSNRPVPDGLRYVGVRAHFLQVSPCEGKNTLSCQIIRVIEDTFSYIVTFRNRTDAVKNDDWTQLRWELEKPEFERLSFEELYLKIPEDQLILLTE